MKKRIVICADGTWNRPEKNLKEDFPTNVLRFARAIKPVADDQFPQQVFYDWGVGSYYDEFKGGITGEGLEKNVMDDYRYIVQNYSPGDELFLFGFSRGAYTVRSLCGFINNCGIVKRPDANLIEAAFKHYKNTKKAFKPKGQKSIEFRTEHSHPSQEIKFIGVWDTVGALGIPISFLGFLNKEDEFYDSKMGSNIKIARHALAIDEKRKDFEPTIWEVRKGVDLKQVWFAGVHSNVGGSYPPDKNTGGLLSDIPLNWMIDESTAAGLSFEQHLITGLNPRSDAKLHNSMKWYYRSRGRLHRKINHGKGSVFIHKSVKERWDNNPKYRPRELVKYVKKYGWTTLVD